LTRPQGGYTIKDSSSFFSIFLRFDPYRTRTVNTLPHDNSYSGTSPRRSLATWATLSLVLICWWNASTSLWGGCFPGDDYRSFHHGSFFQSHPVLSNEPIESRSKTPKAWIYEASIYEAWIYEDGTFQPLPNPLPPQCDGPGCRSNPLDNQWGQPNSTVDTTRIVYGSSTESLLAHHRQGSLSKFPSHAESPSAGDAPWIDRPPKFSHAL
jgi:hypothetical protein